MKVAFMMGSLNRGGTETLLLDCFQHRSSAAFDFIGIYRKEGQLSDAYCETQVPLFRLRPRSVFDLRYFWHLRRFIHSEQLTLLHAQQPLDAVFARMASFGMPVKIVLTLHGYDYGLHRFERWLMRVALRLSDRILCVSNTQKAYYQQRYSLPTAKIRTLYNGISFEKLDQAVMSSIREELHLPKECLLLGSVGNFVSVRDQMTLCRFLKIAHASTLDFRFLFVGAKSASEPERYDECVRYCTENGLMSHVLFLGTRHDVPSILNQLDAFLYASDHDTFGIAVIEAMASRVPVFVNDWEVMREITDEGRYATLYKTKQEEDLWRVFHDFITHPDSYRQKAQQAATWTRQHFSIQSYLSQLKEIYMEVSKE